MTAVEPIRNIVSIENLKSYLKDKNFRNYLLFIIGINSGLRISDILNLKVADVRNKTSIELYERKTGKYKRFPITDFYKLDLENFIIGKADSDWLFMSTRGDKPITRVQAYRIIREACSALGITDRIGTHTLRKTFGYHFYQKKKI